MAPISVSPETTDLDVVDHRVVGSRLRPPAAPAVIEKSVAAAVAIGLSEELAETLAHAAADQQQLRGALRSPKIQRFGREEFTYIEFDVLTWRILPSPDNIRFEGDHARRQVGMPRFGAVDGKPLLTFAMDSAEDMIRQMSPRIADMAEVNPHVESILDRGIETPGWLSFLRLTTDLGTVTRLESTDGFGRTVAAHKGLDITFKDAAWNLGPGSRRAANLHRDLAEWAGKEILTEEQARKVRCSIMPNARVIIFYGSTEAGAPRGYDRARRRFVAHLHMSPPMSFSTATTLNAKANAAVDTLFERNLLPLPPGMTIDDVRNVLDGAKRPHEVGLKADEAAVLACSALNPQQNRREARAVNEAIADLTGVKAKLEDRTQLAAEVALREFPADNRLTGLRSALERAWRWTLLRSVVLTRQTPQALLAEALREVVQFDEDERPATAELAALASYHLVSGPKQLLARSEFGSRGSNVEPQQIMRQLAKTDVGLRQLCQIILDGRAGRVPQRLPEGTAPQDTRFDDAEDLTAERLRELTKLADKPGITYESPQDIFAAAIHEFETCVESLEIAAEEIGSVTDDRGLILVDQTGYSNDEVRQKLQGVSDLVSEWRGTKRRATRQRGDLDGGEEE